MIDDTAPTAEIEQKQMNINSNQHILYLKGIYKICHWC